MNYQLENKGSYHYVKITCNNNRWLGGNCIFSSFRSGFSFYVLTDNKEEHHFKTLQEAIDFILSDHEETKYRAALARINESINKQVAESQNLLSLKVAAFRANLFTQTQILKAA